MNRLKQLRILVYLVLDEEYARTHQGLPVLWRTDFQKLLMKRLCLWATDVEDAFADMNHAERVEHLDSIKPNWRTLVDEGRL